MNDLEQNNLAGKLLRLLKIWIDALIPEQTKECIRSKVAIIVKKNSDGTFNVVLSEDFPDGVSNYEQLSQRTDIDTFSIDNLFTIKNETYNLGDFVIVGYLDNKLTNAFILCKNKK